MKREDFPAAVSVEEPSVVNSWKTDGIPSGFVALNSGIYECGSEEGAEPVWLCSPIRVKALFRRADGKGWGRLVELLDPEGRCQTLALFDREIESKPARVRERLADLGLKWGGGSRARAEVMRLIQEWRPGSTLTSTDRLGWTNATCSGFVFRGGKVLGSGQFLFTGTEFDAEADGVGTSCEWRDNVGALCVSNQLLVLTVSLSFSAPLLEFLDEEGGGIHLRGASSCGKTTIQRVAASVWGDPARIGTWRVTANGVEEIAKVHNSTLLSLDEISEISAKDLYDASYMLANGRGKARALAGGGSLARAAWRVCILSTGEISVADKLSEAGRNLMAGQDVRLLDIEADSGRYGAFDNLHGYETGAAFSDRLKRAAAGFHGTVGPEFVRHLLTHKARLQQKARR